MRRPCASSLCRLGSEVIAQIHRRVVAIACEKCIVRGRRLRFDTTVKAVAAYSESPTLVS